MEALNAVPINRLTRLDKQHCGVRLAEGLAVVYTLEGEALVRADAEEGDQCYQILPLEGLLPIGSAAEFGSTTFVQLF